MIFQLGMTERGGVAISLGLSVIETLDGDGPKPSLTVLVYDRLKDEILQVRRRPCDLLLEGDLAKLYQVSKTPVREALRYWPGTDGSSSCLARGT